MSVMTVSQRTTADAPRQRTPATVHQPSPSDPSATAVTEPLRAMLGGGGLRSHLQPVVDLRSGVVVAHEALLRGPAGTELESPLALLARAHELGCAGDLDVAALAAHLAHVVTRLGTRETTLFVNLEPATLSTHLDEVIGLLGDRPASLQVVVEFTERALAADPAGILGAAERLRGVGCAIALDDVGAEPASLGFVPLLRPEVVKLDLGLLRTVEDVATITVAHAVRAYAEEAGADVVAEGIETPADRTRAVVLGATLGQGWLWGRPGPEPVPARYEGDRFEATSCRAARTLSPYAMLAPGRAQRGPKSLLLAVSRGMELAAEKSRVPPVLLACFQDAVNFTPATARRYAALAETLPLVAALAVGMPARPREGVAGGDIHPEDALRTEWTVVVVGAHEATALIAAECDPPDDAEGDERWFSFAVTHDRALVTEAALLLAERLDGVTLTA